MYVEAVVRILGEDVLVCRAASQRERLTHVSRPSAALELVYSVPEIYRVKRER